MVWSKGEKLGPDNNPGGARWCLEHGRLECTKSRTRRQGGGQCHARAIQGLNACKNHSGHRVHIAKSKGQARITAWSAIGKPANGEGVDSGMAVLGVLQMTWLRLAAYGELLRQQVTGQNLAEPDPDGFDPQDSNPNGLIGFKYGAAGKDGTIYAVNEEVRALVILEAQERDRVVKFAKTAHDMGISERLTNLAEKWGDVVAGRITMILTALELTPEQESRVPALIQTHLGSIDMDAMGGTTNDGANDHRGARLDAEDAAGVDG